MHLYTVSIQLFANAADPAEAATALTVLGAAVANQSTRSSTLAISAGAATALRASRTVLPLALTALRVRSSLTDA
jgi:hypothetical protein